MNHKDTIVTLRISGEELDALAACLKIGRNRKGVSTADVETIEERLGELTPFVCNRCRFVHYSGYSNIYCPNCGASFKEQVSEDTLRAALKEIDPPQPPTRHR